MSDETLRTELLGWQEGQRVLYRWRLGAIGGVAALALGLTSKTDAPQLLVMCLAPFIAAYCDSLLRDHDLRIALIAFYLKQQGGSFAGYEHFLDDHPVSSSRWWALANRASLVSSLGVCGLTAASGMYGLLLGVDAKVARLEFYATSASAVVGAVLVLWIERQFAKKYSQLWEAAAKA